MVKYCFNMVANRIIICLSGLCYQIGNIHNRRFGLLYLRDDIIHDQVNFFAVFFTEAVILRQIIIKQRKLSTDISQSRGNDSAFRCVRQNYFNNDDRNDPDYENDQEDPEPETPDKLTTAL